MEAQFTPNTRTFKPYAGWKQGHAEHLVFLVRLNELDSDEIFGKMRDMQEGLAASPAYIPFTDDYLHITAKALGFVGFDHAPNDIESIIRQTSSLLANHGKFEISLHGIGMFPSVVYIKIHDNGQFHDINKSLLRLKESPAMKFDSPNFIPHLALGTYKENEDIRGLAELVDRTGPTEFGKTLVNHIDLVIARWQDTKFPVFELIERFELK